MIVGYKFNEQERKSLEEHDFNPDLFSSIAINGKWLSFAYDDMWFLNKKMPRSVHNVGEFIATRLNDWITNPTHK